MNIYKHKHHIIPRHAGGTNDPSNIIELTIEEHAEAHRILYEQYGRWQDYVAWKGLSYQISHRDICSIAGKVGGNNLWKIPGMKLHLSNIRKKQSESKNNPMQGKKHARVSCIHCKIETSVNNVFRNHNKCGN